MWIKKIVALSVLITSSSNLLANESTELFKKYYPNIDCSRSECASKIPSKALRAFFEKAEEIHPEKLDSNTYAFIIDFNQQSKNKRGYLLNLKTGASTNYHVAHGKGSDTNHDGIAERFSNVPDSLKSSLGMYATAETYNGKYGRSLKLDGLEGSNDNARSRAIVMHGANYMSSSFINANGKAGRSYGCPALNFDVKDDVINKIKGGSLLYIHKD